MHRRWTELTSTIGSVARGPHWPALLAIALSVVSLVEASVYADPNDRGVAMLVALCATIPIAGVDRRPVLVAVVVTTIAFVMLADTVPITGSAVVAELVALSVVASRTRRRVAMLFAIPFLLNAVFPIGGSDLSGISVLLAVLAIGALALGDARRLRREAIAERDVSRQQAAEALHDQAAMEERALIARELHDVVAHHVSKIAVQAEAARLTTPDLPDEGQERFGEIAASARDALSEMRQLLGVLREDAGGGGERAPQPGLADLQGLVDDARATGTDVRFRLQGAVVPLAPGADLAAYRIVQEALTNARRHAPGAAVEIDLRYEPDALHLRVRDEGPGPSGDDRSDGNGLLGMRERAEIVGGTLRAGAASEGGFEVDTTLPVDGVSDEVTA